MELRATGSKPLSLLLWWVTLMVMAAAVPAFAAFVLMGSASLAVTIGLITAGGVGLAAVLI
ncbi:hypothetical protein [Prescottella sp. R16]|uniref:hypothetical protein n=1 Tax=Prescottella sp. R16 TaxID=3064529 RepID=UPI00272E882D|nr:hypothetical protein [Prescottella sp. R16]